MAKKLRLFDSIPQQRPQTALLDTIQSPADLRRLALHQLPQLCDELRAFLLYSVGLTGGHLGANLGVVELTVALHYVYRTPHDRIIWDVGHQCYPHKILTGRREQMETMRQQDGLKGFPSRDESPYDTFGTGHSSTSISAALGMEFAHRLGQQAQNRSGSGSSSGSRQQQQPPSRFIAVIGDGAMTAGMAYEAMCHTGAASSNLLVILNDNRMSISPNVGGLANYLGRFWASGLYSFLRRLGQTTLSPMPALRRLSRRLEAVIKSFFVSPSSLFESLNFSYSGPLDGHDILSLVHALRIQSGRTGPRMLHLMTRKGAGLVAAEADPVGYHAISKVQPQRADSAAKPQQPLPKYQDVFGQWLCERAAADPNLMAITPAMREGSGMVDFARNFAGRYFDVAIAEQHALTLAAGMACEGKKPVVAIYSTFLQRAYDQLIHDISIQNLDILLAIDRAGLVGEDGPTHAGAYDLSFLRCVPNILLATPSDQAEMHRLLNLCYSHPGPAAVRYPRGAVIAPLGEPGEPTPPSSSSTQTAPRTTAVIGKALVRRTATAAHSSPALLAFGPTVAAALQAAQTLDATVVDMRFVKPLDEHTVCDAARRHKTVLTLEDNVLAGGAGSAVLECLRRQNITADVRCLGIPDRHLAAAPRPAMLAECGLDVAGIIAACNR